MSGIGTKNFVKVYCGTKEVNSVYAGNNKVYSSGPPTYALLSVNNTTENSVGATLNIAKDTSSVTKIYLDNVLKITTTTTGTQDISLGIPTGTHEIKIDGEFYFDDYCLGSASNNAYLTSIILPNTYTQSVGNNVFYNCSNLTETRFYGTLTQWMNITFSGSFSNPTTYSHNLYLGNSNTSVTTISASDLSGVTQIKQWTFDGLQTLTSITIPTSVTSIGKYAFNGCTGLTRVDYNGTFEQWINIDFGSSAANPVYNSHILYISNTSLTSISANDWGNITTIKPYVFAGLSALTSVTLASSITTIGNGVFINCSGISTINLSNIVDIGISAFSGCTSLNITSNSLTNLITIGNGAFRNCTSLTITFDSLTNLTTIGDYAFEGCTSFQYIDLPSSITSLGIGAFENCSNVIRVDLSNYTPTALPDGTSSYPIDQSHGVFARCTSLTTVIFPSTLTTIGSYAFYRCSSMTIDFSLTNFRTIGDHAFDGCTSITSLVFPSSLQTLGLKSFMGCSGVTTIDLSACTSLQTIPSGEGGTLTVSGGTFSNCSNATTLLLPTSLTTIGSYAFYLCGKLASIDITGNSITTIGEYAFNLKTGTAATSGVAQRITLPTALTKAKCGDYSLAVAGQTVSTNYSGTNCPVYYQGTSADFTTNFSPNTASAIFGKCSGNSATKYTFVYCLGDSTAVQVNFSTSQCIARDSKLTLADGTHKKIQDITTDDLVMAYNHDTGTLEISKLLFIEEEPEENIEVNKLTFSDGTVTKFVYEHGYFNVEQNKYVYLHPRTCHKYIGQHFLKADKTVVELIDVELIEERTTCYGITTNNLNVVVDDMLSIEGGIDGIFNIFDYDKDLKYITEEDIANIGLYNYDTFMADMRKEIGDTSKYDEIVRLVFDYYPTKYFKIAIAKGMLDWNGIIYLIDRYCSDEEHTGSFVE